MPLLELIVMFSSIGTEFNLFQANYGLFLLGFLCSFAFLILEFAIIHDFTNRWISIRRNFNQVQPYLLSKFNRFPRWHNSELLIILINHKNFSCPNPPIHSILLDLLLIAVSSTPSPNFLHPQVCNRSSSNENRCYSTGCSVDLITIDCRLRQIRSYCSISMSRMQIKIDHYAAMLIIPKTKGKD